MPAIMTPPESVLLPQELQTRVESELVEREELLWVGQPRPNAFLRGTIPSFLFAIPWTAFALFWTCMAAGGINNFTQIDHGPPGVIRYAFPLFGVPFILIGLGMLSTPPLLARSRARRTVYAVTNQRVIAWEAAFRSVSVRTYGSADLGEITRMERADGSGDLHFENSSWSTRLQNRRSVPSGLVGIADVRGVEALIRRTLIPDRAGANHE